MVMTLPHTTHTYKHIYPYSTHILFSYLYNIIITIYIIEENILLTSFFLFKGNLLTYTIYNYM